MAASEERLRRIAAEEARKLYEPARIGDITASIGANFQGEEAYFIEMQIEQDYSNRDEAAGRRIALRIAIRDRLVADGDELYPCVQISNWREEVA